MKHYIVRWEIDIEADSAEEAARRAREIQQRRFNIASVFEVQRRGADIPEIIDLGEDCDEDNEITVG